MNRRNILILIAIIVLGILGGGAYWYFSQKTPSSPNTGGQFPDESKNGTHPNNGNQGGTTTGGETGIFTPGTGAALPRLFELHKAPVAGTGFFETKDKKGNTTNITARYLERSLGNIFETQLSTYAESRIVNETRPHISEALWGNGGNSVVVRFIDDQYDGMIQSHIINIINPGVSFSRSTSTPSTSTDYLKTEEIYLPNYISFMSTSGDASSNLFYLVNGVDATIGSSGTFKDTTVTKIFSSSFTEWLPQYPNQKLVTLTTKPSADIPGHLFFLDPKTKVITKILSGINGLTTLASPDGKSVLYSETKDGKPSLSLYNVAKASSQNLSLQTLPEKCAWGKKITTVIYCAVPESLPSGTYPDQWYQGLISFTDDIWSINTVTLEAAKIMSPKDYKASALDIINPVLSSDDTYLLFMNKVTGAPWLYSIALHLPAAPQTSTGATTSSATTPSTVSVPPSVITPDMQKVK